MQADVPPMGDTVWWCTAPSSITVQQTDTVRATSVLDPSKYAEATITLLPQ